MSDIDKKAYWEKEKALLYADMYPLIFEAAQESAALNAADLNDELDAEAIEKQARTWAAKYTTQLVDDITNTTRDAVHSVIKDAQALSNFDLSQVESRLDALYSEARAASVAVTETTSAFSNGALFAFAALDVEQVIWQTEEDDAVDDVCIENAAAGAVVLGDAFPSGDTEPPAHPNCRCWLVPA